MGKGYIARGQCLSGPSHRGWVWGEDPASRAGAGELAGVAVAAAAVQPQPHRHP
jgi:hypothetical protein